MVEKDMKIDYCSYICMVVVLLKIEKKYRFERVVLLILVILMVLKFMLYEVEFEIISVG